MDKGGEARRGSPLPAWQSPPLPPGLNLPWLIMHSNDPVCSLRFLCLLRGLESL